MNMLRKTQKKKRFAFTLAELIVVITVLAVLAAIAFVALSGYAKDAADSRAKANVRSVYTAISSEAVVSGNSPRFYVVHNPSFELSGAFAFTSGSPAVLV